MARRIVNNRTRSTKPKGRPQQPAPSNGLKTDVLTLTEAADYLRLTEGDVLRLIHQQGLPARQVGSEWRFLLPAIRDWLRVGARSKSNREAWIELAGVWKDDPHFDELLREIDKVRG